jgi:prophage antirepressor-like protein
MTIHESNIGGEKINGDAAINPLLFEGEHLIRQVEKDGEVWFVGLDICRVLGIKDHHQALERLDEDERGGYTIPTPMGDQSMIVVSEPGVYRLVFTSRKPVAERFKRWLAHEVIPSIRKTGSYGGPPPQGAPESQDERPFPHWPMEEMRTKRGCVDMFRLLYGVMAAQWVAPQLGFPTPPLELVDRGRQYSLVLVPQVEAAA